MTDQQGDKSRTRVRHVGKWKGRAYRAGAAVQSVGAALWLWWLMPWSEKMMLLWMWEETPPDERAALAAAYARAMRRAWVAQMSKPDGTERHP